MGVAVYWIAGNLLTIVQVYLHNNTNLTIHYITSDLNDAIFELR